MGKHQQSLFDVDPAPWELDEAGDRLLAEVVFAEAPFGPFDYLVPDLFRGQIAAGCRVVVPLGRGKRQVTGYCVRLMPLSEAGAQDRDRGRHRLKEIASLVDPQPLMSPSMLRLTQWMADYYVCAWGQVLDAVVPADVRGRAGTRAVTFLSVPARVAAKLSQLNLPPKQAKALGRLAATSRPMTLPQLCAAAECTAAPIRALQQKGLIQAVVQRVHQQEHDLPAVASEAVPVLNSHQRQAVDVLRTAVSADRSQTVLVYGVTGSGKTEVYMRAMEEVLSFGRQAIILVPEISLTPQTVARFRARFDRVAVLHSHLSPPERNWHWKRIAQGDVAVVVGARSAVFAPTPQLGLIVLDEEHDASFKQETAPCYHARDVALQRGQREGIPVVLGSATPSLDSWQRAQQGTYQIVELPKRVMARPLPPVDVIDLRTEYQNRFGRGAISRPLAQAMKEALREGGQIILLLNRRGYSTFIQCPACGEVVRCPECDIALTHHREGERAVCHYCDYATTAPTRCPACNFEGIRFGGLGTQRLEAEIRARFPDAACLRMDSDTMQKHGSHEQALARFRNGDIRILLGTQMIAKGLDFPNVTLVGVVNADTALHFPDYRAAERTFQLVTQVAGRTGRGPRGGRVLVQTFSPDHFAIQTAVRHDYPKFAERELADRIAHHFPPATEMVRLVVRGPSERSAEAAAEEIHKRVLEALASTSAEVRVLGPAEAPIAKLRGKFRFHLLLLSTDGQPLRAAAGRVKAELQFPNDIQWTVDVDPWDML